MAMGSATAMPVFRLPSAPVTQSQSSGKAEAESKHAGASSGNGLITPAAHVAAGLTTIAAAAARVLGPVTLLTPRSFQGFFTEVAGLQKLADEVPLYHAQYTREFNETVAKLRQIGEKRWHLYNLYTLRVDMCKNKQMPITADLSVKFAADEKRYYELDAQYKQLEGRCAQLSTVLAGLNRQLPTMGKLAQDAAILRENGMEQLITNISPLVLPGPAVPVSRPAPSSPSPALAPSPQVALAALAAPAAAVAASASSFTQASSVAPAAAVAAASPSVAAAAIVASASVAGSPSATASAFVNAVFADMTE